MTVIDNDELFLVFPGRGRAFEMVSDFSETKETPETFLRWLFAKDEFAINEINSQEKRNTIKACFGELIDYPDFPLKDWEIDAMKRRGSLGVRR